MNLSCPRVPALGALLHAWNLCWLSVLHVLMYMFQCYSLSQIIPHLPSPTKSTSLFFTSVSLIRVSISFLFFSVFFPSFELKYVGELLSCGCFFFFLPQLVSFLLIRKYIYIFWGFSHIGYYRVQSKFTCVIQWVLVIYFINSIGHILV